MVRLYWGNPHESTQHRAETQLRLNPLFLSLNLNHVPSDSPTQGFWKVVESGHLPSTFPKQAFPAVASPNGSPQHTLDPVVHFLNGGFLPGVKDSSWGVRQTHALVKPRATQERAVYCGKWEVSTLPDYSGGFRFNLTDLEHSYVAGSSIWQGGSNSKLGVHRLSEVHLPLKLCKMLCIICAFFWKGLHGFHQILKGTHAPKG